MTSPDDEVPFLVVQTYGSHREIVLYPTSRVIRANCGHLSWLSPQGEHMLATAYTICTDCQDATYHPSDEEEMVAVPGAVESLREIHGDDVADWVREEIQRKGIKEL